MNSKFKSFLEIIDIIAGTPDPCSWCKHMKRVSPKEPVSCSGNKNLCNFRDTFFLELPRGLERESLMTRAILNCSNKFEYRELMDKVFSMNYIERCIQVKFMIDSELSALYPHMVPIIACYDALILRYCFPHIFEAEYIIQEMD